MYQPDYDTMQYCAKPTNSTKTGFYNKIDYIGIKNAFKGNKKQRNTTSKLYTCLLRSKNTEKYNMRCPK